MKRVLFAIFLVSISACDSSNDRGRGNGNGNGNGNGSGDADGGSDASTDDPGFYVNDPPPSMCSLDGGMFPQPKPPGGTLECPDDKNREGCDCPAEGMTVACWPGARKNRGLGICKDGVTTCTQKGELQLAWGPCKGAVLPDPNATDGARACKCFSHGLWKLDNLSPCFLSSNTTPGSAGAISTVPAGAGNYDCPSIPVIQSQNPPTEDWTTDTITADCSGRFTLCYSLKAGKADSPQPGDCEVVKVCTKGDYTDVNKAQVFPPLPPWRSSNTACSQQFATMGGYGEMSVEGITVACDKFSRVFNRVNYCASSCKPGSTDPACANCSQGGSGGF